MHAVVIQKFSSPELASVGNPSLSQLVFALDSSLNPSLHPPTNRRRRNKEDRCCDPPNRGGSYKTSMLAGKGRGRGFLLGKEIATFFVASVIGCASFAGPTRLDFPAPVELPADVPANAISERHFRHIRHHYQPQPSVLRKVHRRSAVDALRQDR